MTVLDVCPVVARRPGENVRRGITTSFRSMTERVVQGVLDDGDRMVEGSQAEPQEGNEKD